MTRALLILTIYATSVCCVSCGNPSDQELLDRFRANSDDFRLLVSMLQEDADITRLTSENVFMSNDSNRVLPVERLAKYRWLMKKLHLDGGVHRDTVSSIRLIANSPMSRLWPTVEKSYLFSSDPSCRIVQATDDLNQTNNQEPVCKAINAQWYIRYETW